MSVESFSLRYKSFSSKELMEIIQSGGDYQLPAVEAAEQELRLRQLTDDEMENLRRQYLSTQLQKFEKEGRSFDKQTTQAFRSLLADLNPLTKTATERRILFILFTTGIYFLYNLITGFKWLIYLISHFMMGSITGYLISYLLLPAGLILFYKKRQAGWVILTAWITYMAVYLCRLAVNYIVATYRYVRFISPVTLLVVCIVCGALVFTINQKAVRQAYTITIQMQSATIALSCLVAFLLLLL